MFGKDWRSFGKLPDETVYSDECNYRPDSPERKPLLSDFSYYTLRRYKEAVVKVGVEEVSYTVRWGAFGGPLGADKPVGHILTE